MKTEQKEGTTIEPYDDNKAEDLMAIVISDLSDRLKPGWTEFLEKSHSSLFKKINRTAALLTIARCKADMQAVVILVEDYRTFLIEGCRLHCLYLEEEGLL